MRALKELAISVGWVLLGSLALALICAIILVPMVYWPNATMAGIIGVMFVYITWIVHTTRPGRQR